MVSKNKTTILYSDNIIIRKFCLEDKQAVRTLCCDTAYFGEPCEAFFPNRELLADLMIKYYTDYESEHTWIAEYKGEIVGYISAYFDEARYNRVMSFKIIPISLMQALIRGKVWNKKTYRMIVYIAKSLLLREAKLENLDYRKFPVHFQQRVRHKGVCF